MTEFDGCQAKYRTPVPEERECPACGAPVEVFTRAGRVTEDTLCPWCGFCFFAERQPVFAPKTADVPAEHTPRL